MTDDKAVDRPDRILPAESEMNQPADLSVGWKPWTGRDGYSYRWWTGKQWTETYQPQEPPVS